MKKPSPYGILAGMREVRKIEEENDLLNIQVSELLTKGIIDIELTNSIMAKIKKNDSDIEKLRNIINPKEVKENRKGFYLFGCKIF